MSFKFNLTYANLFQIRDQIKKIHEIRLHKNYNLQKPI